MPVGDVTVWAPSADYTKPRPIHSRRTTATAGAQKARDSFDIMRPQTSVRLPKVRKSGGGKLHPLIARRHLPTDGRNIELHCVRSAVTTIGVTGDTRQRSDCGQSFQGVCVDSKIVVSACGEALSIRQDQHTQGPALAPNPTQTRFLSLRRRSFENRGIAFLISPDPNLLASIFLCMAHSTHIYRHDTPSSPLRMQQRQNDLAKYVPSLALRDRKYNYILRRGGATLQKGNRLRPLRQCSAPVLHRWQQMQSVPPSTIEHTVRPALGNCIAKTRNQTGAALMGS